MLSTADATRQIPDIKLMPHSIYDALSRCSYDLQWLLCRVQCRQPVAVGAARHDMSPLQKTMSINNISKHCTSCDLTITDAHITISMLK